jgi:CBS domain-containing protein
VKVEDVMTRDVRSVDEATPIKEVARVLVAAGISGVPVCGADGYVVGVVSERDILVKERGPRDEPEGMVSHLLERRATRDPSKAAARTAGEAMTAPAVTVAPDRPLAAAARMLLDHGVKRLPVVDRAGVLRGILTRTDLVRAFARADDEIAEEIEDAVLHRALWLEPGDVTVHVEQGEVTLDGAVERAVDAEVLPRLVARVPGVVAVESHVFGRDHVRA